MACDNYKDWKLKIHWENWDMSCLSNMIKKNPFCTSSEFVFKGWKNG